MVGTLLPIEGHTVYAWENSFSVNGTFVHVDRNNPEKMAAELLLVLERYRKNENERRRKQFEEENYA